MADHMFVTATSYFAEDLCAVELYGSVSPGRAGELARIHHGHLLEECAVLRAVMVQTEVCCG
ncbi:hypothetical protein K7711_38295 [Nocardia sp. CA2R105]|uniref:hypothetical protein n=1 Tax=Nocardia coffeae TaxID=2873381 RepID=UPI001CA6E28B|nr:hypothetical protein [Nocardia coffeae]MBY8862375.1 hypothetical protein [Nocardia coffeae]